MVLKHSDSWANRVGQDQTALFGKHFHSVSILFLSEMSLRSIKPVLLILHFCARKILKAVHFYEILPVNCSNPNSFSIQCGTVSVHIYSIIKRYNGWYYKSSTMNFHISLGTWILCYIIDFKQILNFLSYNVLSYDAASRCNDVSIFWTFNHFSFYVLSVIVSRVIYTAIWQ